MTIDVHTRVAACVVDVFVSQIRGREFDSHFFPFLFIFSFLMAYIVVHLLKYSASCTALPSLSLSLSLFPLGVHHCLSLASLSFPHGHRACHPRRDQWLPFMPPPLPLCTSPMAESMTGGAQRGRKRR